MYFTRPSFSRVGMSNTSASLVFLAATGPDIVRTTSWEGLGDGLGQSNAGRCNYFIAGIAGATA